MGLVRKTAERGVLYHVVVKEIDPVIAPSFDWEIDTRAVSFDYIVGPFANKMIPMHRAIEKKKTAKATEAHVIMIAGKVGAEDRRRRRAEGRCLFSSWDWESDLDDSLGFFRNVAALRP